MTFSADPEQRDLLVGDGQNNVIWFVNRNMGEVDTGKRLQKFILQ